MLLSNVNKNCMCKQLFADLKVEKQDKTNKMLKPAAFAALGGLGLDKLVKLMLSAAKFCLSLNHNIDE